MDGIPALDLWDLTIEVLHSDSNRKQQLKPELGNPSFDKASAKKQCNTQNSLALSHVYFVPSNAKCSREGTKLYMFEDNEAVIKMIMKGRSPHLRHVSRTHQVELDWLFDRINLDLKIRIRYVNSKNQLADISTKRHFTRDEWNNLLCLFNIRLFSSQSCAAFIPENRSEGLAKRQQGGDHDERVVAESKPVRNLVSRSRLVPSTTPSSTVSSNRGNSGQKITT